VDELQAPRRQRFPDQEVGEWPGRPNGRCCEKDADQERGNRVGRGRTAELLHGEPSRGDCHADQSRGILDGKRSESGIARLA
jgi:hypothetical protein